MVGAVFEKDEVVQCTKCESWMKAPTRAAGLNCANENCRERIWPMRKLPERKDSHTDVAPSQGGEDLPDHAEPETIPVLEDKLLGQLQELYQDPATGERNSEVLKLIREFHRKAGEWCQGCGKPHSVHCIDCLPKRRGRPRTKVESAEAKKERVNERRRQRARKGPQCEDCFALKRPHKSATWGLPEPGDTSGLALVARWCAHCARINHMSEGARPSLASKARICEDCGVRSSNWGLPPENPVRALLEILPLTFHVPPR